MRAHLDERKLLPAAKRAGDGRLLGGIELALQGAPQPRGQAAVGQRRRAARLVRRLGLQQVLLQRLGQLADAAQRLQPQKAR